jgi:phospholipid/cholesterol/gamma-HCH transport system substrate-binding protein
MKTVQHIRLGLLVLVASVLLIAGLYYVGQQRHIFGSTVTLHAMFTNIDGLMSGNNVRYNGYNIGMVLDVMPANDSLVDVAFSVNESMMHLISKNAKAKLITDGLLGNKIVEIEPGFPFERAIAEGDVLAVRKQPDMDKAMRTLNESNNNLLSVSADLRSITGRFSTDNSLWQLLADTGLSPQFRNIILNVDRTSQRAATISEGLSGLLKDVQSGKGNLGALLVDSSAYTTLNGALLNVKELSDTLLHASVSMKEIAAKVNAGNGNVSVLLNDTTMAEHADLALIEIKEAANSLNQSLSLLRQSSFMRRYLKRKNTSEKVK